MRPNADRPACMAAIGTTSKETIANRIDLLELVGKVVIAVYNGDQSHVVSGEAWAVDKLVDSLSSDGSRIVKLNVDQGSPTIFALYRVV